MAKRRTFQRRGGSVPDNELQRAPNENQQTEAVADEAALQSRIAARAYALFLARGGQHGDDLADWLQAEREVLAEERPAPDPEGP